MKATALYLLGAVIFYTVRIHDKRDIEIIQNLTGEDVNMRFYRVGAAIGSIIWPIGTVLCLMGLLVPDIEKEEGAE